MDIKARDVEYFYSTNHKAPVKEWLFSIKDSFTQALLFKRIHQASLGHLGDIKSVGEGVHEMRIHYGPGYRLYFGIYKNEIILLLAGGSKKTQRADIEKAKANWTKWKEQKKCQNK